MSNSASAFVLAGALYNSSKRAPTSEAIYDIVDALDFGEDERKADLYAQLEERLSANTTFEEATAIIEDAMNQTDARYPRG